MSSTNTFVQHDRPVDAPDRVRQEQPRRTGFLLVALVAVLAAITATMVLQWYTATGRSAASTTIPSGPPAAYQTGGSVNEQQVPDHVDWPTGYGPTSQLYNEQVPQAR